MAEQVTFLATLPDIRIGGTDAIIDMLAPKEVGMPKAIRDWYATDTSEWPSLPDSEIGRRLGVDKSVIDYWRKKLGIATFRNTFKTEREERFAAGLSWCSRCKTYKPVSTFGPLRHSLYNLRAWCIPCRADADQANAANTNERKRRRYQDDPQRMLRPAAAWRERNKEYVASYMRQRHSALKAHYAGLMGGCCQRCGYAEFTSGLDFHHVNGDGKIEKPTAVVASGDFERAVKELDKCALLCRNCHQAYHGSDWTATFAKREGLGWTIQPKQ